MRTNVLFHRAVLCLALCTAACSGSDDGAPSAGAGGLGGASGGGAGGASGAGEVSGGAGGGGGTAGAAGTAGLGGAGGMIGTDAGAGGMIAAGAGGMMAGAGGMGGEPPITECGGKMLPPRAIASATPHMIGPAAAGLPEYFPTDAWRSMAPEMLGLDPVKLDAAVNYSAAGSNTQAVFVVRHGYVAAEKYFGATSASTRHESYSMAKSFSSTLIGIAIDQGLVASTDEKLCMYYPTYWDCANTSDLRSKITIDHAMNISTGLQWEENWRSDATGNNDAVSSFLIGMLETVLSRPAVEEPGTHMRYSTGDPALLSGVFEVAAGKSAYEYAQEVLLGPLGITGLQWASDSRGRTNTFAGIQATAQEYAKLGLLFLNKGKWDGQQIVSEAWVDKTTQGPEPCSDWYRYLWHQNPPVRLGTQPASCAELHCTPSEFADLPPDLFFAEGINGQFIFVIPSTDMVVVRLANDSPGSEHWDEYAAQFLRSMIEAVM